ncbi:MAG: hypothetical protein AAF328_05345 [Planctomycetota bacterium]
MKVILSISGVHLEEEKIKLLSTINSEARVRQYWFSSWLEESDPRNESILSMLSDFGLSPKASLDKQDYAKEFRMSRIRLYDHDDYYKSDYLECHPHFIESHNMPVTMNRDESGLLRFARSSLHPPPTNDIVLSNSWNVLSIQAAMDALEPLNLMGLTFKPTQLVHGQGGDAQWNRPVAWEDCAESDPWWELSSEITLPPLSPSMDLQDAKRRPIERGDRSRGYVPREASFSHAELHYLRSDLAAVEPFDAAVTYESFGSDLKATPRLIVSQRFYQACVDSGLKGQWIPVRIDEN